MPAWEVAHTVPEARAAAERILADGAGAVVIKAQVLVGGRGKAGGVKLASTADEAERVAGAILGHGHQGHHRSARCWWRPRPTSPASSTCRPCSTGPAGRILLMGSAEGGVEIEQVAAAHPEAIIRHHADPLLGLLDYQAREFAFAMGLGGHLKAAVAIAKGLVRTMLAYDADLVEINPLAIVRETGSGRHPRRAARVPRRQGHSRRLGARRATRASRTCATPTRRIPPIARRARPG